MLPVSKGHAQHSTHTTTIACPSKDMHNNKVNTLLMLAAQQRACTESAHTAHAACPCKGGARHSTYTTTIACPTKDMHNKVHKLLMMPASKEHALQSIHTTTTASPTKDMRGRVHTLLMLPARQRSCTAEYKGLPQCMVKEGGGVEVHDRWEGRRAGVTG